MMHRRLYWTPIVDAEKIERVGDQYRELAVHRHLRTCVILSLAPILRTADMEGNNSEVSTRNPLQVRVQRGLRTFNCLRPLKRR